MHKPLKRTCQAFLPILFVGQKKGTARCLLGEGQLSLDLRTRCVGLENSLSQHRVGDFDKACDVRAGQIAQLTVG